MQTENEFICNTQLEIRCCLYMEIGLYQRVDRTGSKVDLAKYIKEINDADHIAPNMIEAIC